MVRLAVDGMLSFSRAPLWLAVGAGLGLTAASLAASLAVAVAVAHRADPVLIALLAAVHVVGGSVLAAVGVVGAYVVRVFEESKGRPLYVLKDASPNLEAGPARVPRPLPWHTPAGDRGQDAAA
jgi:dolichol-phosphate mannosyltransferase